MNAIRLGGNVILDVAAAGGTGRAGVSPRLGLSVGAPYVYDSIGKGVPRRRGRSCARCARTPSAANSAPWAIETGNGVPYT
jgi:hypothetical protein